MNKKREKSRLQPVMMFLVLTAITLVLSGVLNLLDISQYTYKINSTTLDSCRPKYRRVRPNHIQPLKF